MQSGFIWNHWMVAVMQGCNEGGKGATIPRGVKLLREGPKCLNNVTSSLVGLGHQGEGKLFWEGPKFINDVQYIFQGRRKIFQGYLVPLVTGLGTSTFFNTVHLLPKKLRFEHGGAKLASWPRRHLTPFHHACMSLLNIDISASIAARQWHCWKR